MSVNQLTPAQVNQLVNAVAKSPLACWTALRNVTGLTTEQQQKLIDGVCTEPVHAAGVLKDVPWISEGQKTQMRAAS